MQRQIHRNNVIITSVCTKKGRNFAFGVIMEPKPRTVFFPGWIIDAFELTSEDQGAELDCLFIDQPEDRHPMIIAIIEDDLLQDSITVGVYEGRPGQTDFSAHIQDLVNALNARVPA